MKTLKNLRKFISTRVVILSIIAVIIYLTYYRREKLEGEEKNLVEAPMDPVAAMPMSAMISTVYPYMNGDTIKKSLMCDCKEK